jgi:hypothetical protein
MAKSSAGRGAVGSKPHPGSRRSATDADADAPGPAGPRDGSDFSTEESILKGAREVVERVARYLGDAQDLRVVPRDSLAPSVDSFTSFRLIEVAERRRADGADAIRRQGKA